MNTCWTAPIVLLACVFNTHAAEALAQTTEHDSAVVRFRLETVVDGLRQPSGMAFLPDGRGLLCDRRAAAFYVLDTAARTLTKLQGVPPVLATRDAGLHDVVLHPDYANNDWLYFS